MNMNPFQIQLMSQADNVWILEEVEKVDVKKAKKLTREVLKQLKAKPHGTHSDDIEAFIRQTDSSLVYPVMSELILKRLIVQKSSTDPYSWFIIG